MKTTKDASKILLLCLGTEKAGKKPKEIPLADIRDVFSRFGNLNRILIFSKTAVFKAFLEFEDIKEAQTAQSSLHNSILPKLGQVKLYYSAQEKLEVTNKFVEFWEKSTSLPILKDDDDFTHSSNSSRKLKDNQLNNKLVKDILSESGNRRSKVGFNFSNDGSPISRYEEIKSKSMFTDSRQIILAKGTEFNKKVELGNTISTTDLPQKIEELKIQPSKVVLVSNLDNVFSSVQELFNLFSCFGDINKLILMHNLQKALVEYQKVESARMSIQHLSGLNILNTKLKVNYSKYKKIDIKKSFRNEASLQYNEVLTVPCSLNRYGLGITPDIKSINSKLIFDIEKKSNIKMIDVYFYIEKFAEPESIQIVETNDKSKLRLLLSFEDKATAVRIMSKFHRSDIKTAKVSISFYS